MIDDTDDNGALNLSGKTLRFTAKKDRAFPDSEALFQKSTEDGSITLTEETGVAEIQLSSDDTSDLSAMTHRVHYDVQLSSGDNVYTLVSGLLIIEADVTEGI